MLVKCGRDLMVNPGHISSIEWDRSTYSRPSALIVSMLDGRQIRIPHEPHMMDGNDCYKIEAKLFEASQRVPTEPQDLPDYATS